MWWLKIFSILGLFAIVANPSYISNIIDNWNTTHDTVDNINRYIPNENTKKIIRTISLLSAVMLSIYSLYSLPANRDDGVAMYTIANTELRKCAWLYKAECETIAVIQKNEMVKVFKDESYTDSQRNIIISRFVKYKNFEGWVDDKFLSTKRVDEPEDKGSQSNVESSTKKENKIKDNKNTVKSAQILTLNKNIRLRSCISLKSNECIILVIPKGKKVKVLSSFKHTKDKGTWRKVEYQGKKGWVNEKILFSK